MYTLQKDRRKNEEFVNLVKSGLSYLRNEIKEMSDHEIEIEKPDKIADIVEKILEFNGQNQEEKVLKILTPDQMISRLPITSEKTSKWNKATIAFFVSFKKVNKNNL